jgi:hypothetical protein
MIALYRQVCLDVKRSTRTGPGNDASPPAHGTPHSDRTTGGLDARKPTRSKPESAFGVHAGDDAHSTPRQNQVGSSPTAVRYLHHELAAPAYDILEPDELDQLVDDLEPLAAVLVAAGSQ